MNSIKYKLFIILVVSPLIALGLYLVIAARLFESDKIAYVFDSIGLASRTLSSEVVAELKVFSSTGKPIIEGFDFSKTAFDPTAVKLFDGEKDLLSIAIAKKIPGEGMKVLAQLSKSDFQADSAMQDKLANDACEHEMTVKSGSREGRNFVYHAYCDVSSLNQESFAIVSAYQGDELFRSFDQNGASTSCLVDSQGVPILTCERAGVDGFSKWEFFSSVQSKGKTSGTLRTRSFDLTDVFLSFSKVGNSPFFVVSWVSRDLALEAVKMLWIKSILFFIAIISAAIVLSIFASDKLTSTLRELKFATEKVSEGKFDIHVNVTSKDEVGSLASHFNKMAQEVSRLMVDNIAKARMEKELETARIVQNTLFPPALGDLPPFKIAGHYEPANECGGDWWHYSMNADRIFLWIGDVTGHGAPAALMTSAAKAASSIIERMPLIKPADALSILNRALLETSRGGLQMTFFLAIIDKKTNHLSYCNASHNPPFLIRKASGGGEISAEKFELLDAVSNPRLGEQLSHSFVGADLQLQSDDLLLFYTDGVVDTLSPQGKAWGERNFLKSIVKAVNQSRSPEKIVSQIKADSSDFRKNALLADDVTFFVCHQEGNS